MFITKKIQHGFSLIEVMVSLLVLGVGMLGLSGLQVASMKGTNNAHARTVASMLAMGLGERMRANSAGVEGGFYDNDVDCDTNEPSCRGTRFCTPQEKARFDTQEVMCGVLEAGQREGGAANLLSTGTLQVSCDNSCAVLNTIHNVTVSWSESNTHREQNGESQNKSITISIVP